MAARTIPAVQSARTLPPETVGYWERAWARLDKIDRATHRGANWKRSINEVTDSAAERRIDALAQSDEQDLFRTRLLQWHLERIKGRAQPEVDPPRVAMSWLPGEAWWAARALGPGPTRCATMLVALDQADVGERGERIALADVQVRQEWLAANVLGCAALAQRIDELEPDFAHLERAAWALAQAGRVADAAALVRARSAALADASLEAPAHVLAARTALAQGADLTARAELGAALALGSADAAILSARQLLERGEPQRARVLTRGWIGAAGARDVPDALWALANLLDSSRPVGTRAPAASRSPLR